MKTAARRLPLKAGMMVLALLFVSNTGFAREKAIETPVYQADQLYIAPESHGTVKDWCKEDRKIRFGNRTPRPYNSIVRYTVDHEQRDALFPPSYEEFILQYIATAIKKSCQGVIENFESFHIQFQMSNQKDKSGYNDVLRDQLMFRYRNGKVIQTSYAPGAEMMASKSTEEIEAMRNTVPKTLERLDTVVTKIGPFTIYPHAYPLCTELGIDVDAVFDIPAEQRSDWINEKYGDTPNNGYDLFFLQDIWPALKKSCGVRYNRVRVHYFEKGSTEFYDTMNFKIVAPAYTKSKSYNGIIETQNMSKKAIAVATLRRNKELFGGCTGPFCDKLGNIYLNAIYRNDTKMVRRINGALNREYRAATRFDLNFLFHLSGKYMYDYSQYAVSHKVLTGDWTAACFRAGSKTIDTRTVTEVINYEDQYGIPQGSAGGINIGKKYQINPEFIGLSNRIAGPASGAMGDFLASYFNLEKSKAILSGLEQVIRQTPCESPELRQFERSLVSMTERSLRGWKDSTESPVKTSAPEVTAPQPVVAMPPAKSSIPETHSPATIDSSGENSAVPTRQRQRTRSEVVQPRIQPRAQEQTVRNQRARAALSPEQRQAMAAEVKAVADAIRKTQQATIQEFITRLQNAGSMAKRTKIAEEMRAYQDSAPLELQKAMAEIQQRYQ